MLIHQCKACGTIHANRSAGDDNALLLLRIAVKPLAMPPFPLEKLSQIWLLRSTAAPPDRSSTQRGQRRQVDLKVSRLRPSCSP